MRFLVFILGFFLATQTWAFSPSDLRAFGKSAPVQLYLFTSLTCHHCADFHKNILPQLKREFADTGKAQIIVVDMVSGGNGLMATQTLRCLDVGGADKLEDELYATQSKWMRQDAAAVRKMFASSAARQGMTQEQFNLCLTDQELQKAILEQQANLARLYGITGTPTLVMRDGAEVRKWAGSDKKVLKELREAFQK
ncbi:MAG: DsbA family protein [Alphaproteobacteria bacterium]